MNKNEARVRNLLFKITNWIVYEKGSLKNDLSREYVSEYIYFKKSDLEDYYDILFENNKLKKEYEDKIKGYLNKYKQAKDDKKEDELEQVYKELCELFEGFGENHDKIKEKLEKATKIAKNLHWKYLPIYLEQYIMNNGYDPDEQTSMFYNHFHAIEDLYRYIFTTNKVDWKSKGGDKNIDTEMTFKIYTVRWGHYDTYTIKRTTTGWYLSGLPAGTGKCEKDGTGALIDALEHDSVCYPVEGIKYALCTLWNESDEYMEVEELQNKLNDISTWIKEVEITTHKYQPNWCGYY